MGPAHFPVHMIGHSLSALYDTPHAASLAVVLPGWLRSVLDAKQRKIAQLGRAVFGVCEADDAAAARAAIDAIAAWCASIGVPTTLREAAIPARDVPRIAANARRLADLWGMDDYDEQFIAGVLERCA
jgi:alcohol dehydrogenase YqhD (iron-dependent ADH family)